MRRPLDRRHVLRGIGALIGGYAFTGTVSGEEHEHGENDGTVPSVPSVPSTTYEGTLDEENRRDSYSFEATAGEGIELEMAVLNLEPGRDARMTLLDPDGNEIGDGAVLVGAVSRPVPNAPSGHS